MFSLARLLNRHECHTSSFSNTSSAVLQVFLDFDLLISYQDFISLLTLTDTIKSEKAIMIILFVVFVDGTLYAIVIIR